MSASSIDNDEYEYYPVERERIFTVSNVYAVVTSPPEELQHVWHNRPALCLVGRDTMSTEQLDMNLQHVLERGVRSIHSAAGRSWMWSSLRRYVSLGCGAIAQNTNMGSRHEQTITAEQRVGFVVQHKKTGPIAPVVARYCRTIRRRSLF